jgi:hypothetical protein
LTNGLRPQVLRQRAQNLRHLLPLLLRKLPHNNSEPSTGSVTTLCLLSLGNSANSANHDYLLLKVFPCGSVLISAKAAPAGKVINLPVRVIG